jgi:hypothetical protein
MKLVLIVMIKVYIKITKKAMLGYSTIPSLTIGLMYCLVLKKRLRKVNKIEGHVGSRSAYCILIIAIIVLIDEDYKEAKLYKELGDKLSGYMRLLINLENDKQLAVSTKDYDEADKIKADMIEVKFNAESLLKQNGIEITKEGAVVPIAIEEEEVEQEEVKGKR